jgi:hypothetical protein
MFMFAKPLLESQSIGWRNALVLWREPKQRWSWLAKFDSIE